MPAPLLFALHLAGLTRQIRLGTAIICLNLHHPLAVAEQVAVADSLSSGRLAVGFGSGSTSDEYARFGLREPEEAERHTRFAEALRIMRAAWEGSRDTSPLPIAAPDLASRCWLAVNSLASARIAGSLGFNMLFSHLRTPDEYRAYRSAYIESGGSGLVAANRPVYVGRDDATAHAEVEPALRLLWRRFQKEGKIPATAAEPSSVEELCAHPINFVIGSPQTVANKLLELQRQVPYDVANLEPRWPGLPARLIQDSLRRFAQEVRPKLNDGCTTPPARGPI
jgi:alkanesulfonate monooxygenase SsuD/methylene tetrahydromethanopterin reductase-like flavin-dependent oxidoreductase (luciferase family)